MNRSIIFALATLSINTHAGMVVVGNSLVDNIDGFSMDEIRSIFSGSMTTLDNGETVYVVELDKNSEEKKLFHSLVTGKSEIELESEWAKQINEGRTKGRVFVTDYKSVLKRVSNNPNSIGYVTTEALENNKQENIIVIQEIENKDSY
ncbi:phosphate ABC transporter substrate-binding protein [Vibrio sp. THAF190c]|uniref:phosphate ABC transporter substrate-binding protein n=1 Tax=Vibrio sp. THAF190c TaxID=2587865 RepID=UPI00126907AA|nr:phosphate ABC transporter substrate-binding protein [Vibrio sp. THAF190c]QFT13457.1 hypothetical protein FIV04_26240 [Vibrio sp. THAF190c]